MINFFSKIKGFDWVLAMSTFLLVCIGFIAVYSVALSQDIPDWSNLIKQFIAVIIGTGLFLFFTWIDYQALKSYARYFYVLALLLLAGVLLFGANIRGTKGWFTFGGFNFQPVELVKIIVIIFLA